MREREKKKGAARVQAVEATDGKSPGPLQHERATTAHPVVRALEGGPPIPEELTGRASTTSESLTQLFGNGTAEHLADGFRGGSGDDPDSDIARDDLVTQLQIEAANDGDGEDIEESDDAEQKS